MIHLAKGPCMACGHINDDVLLTGEAIPAQDGGTYWPVAPGETCAYCGCVLPVLYEAPIILELPARVNRYVEA